MPICPCHQCRNDVFDNSRRQIVDTALFELWKAKMIWDSCNFSNSEQFLHKHMQQSGLSNDIPSFTAL